LIATDVPTIGKYPAANAVNPDTVRNCGFTNIFVGGFCLFEINRFAASAATAARFFASRLLAAAVKLGWNHRQLSQAGHPRLHQRFACRFMLARLRATAGTCAPCSVPYGDHFPVTDAGNFRDFASHRYRRSARRLT